MENDNNSLATSGQEHTERAQERPIREVFWEEAPLGDVEESIRLRSREFFNGEEVPPEIKALGVFAEEAFVQTSKDLESANFNQALYMKTPNAGKPTIYGLQLFEDRLNVVMSPIGDYPNFSLEIMTLPLTDLDNITGNVAREMVEEVPHLTEVILSERTTDEERVQAKLDLLRFLAKKHPDNVGALNDSIIPAVAAAYTTDGQNKLLKVYVHDIPTTDPQLGKTMEFYNLMKVYQKIEMNLSREEWREATVEKIEEFLTKLPSKMQHILMGRWPQHGNKAWQIYHFLKRFTGYSGNKVQQKYDMGDNLRFGMTAFEGDLRRNILRTIIEGKSVEETGLNREGIDNLFRESYESFPRNKKLVKGFSIYDIITNQTPITEVKINQ